MPFLLICFLFKGPHYDNLIKLLRAKRKLIKALGLIGIDLSKQNLHQMQVCSGKVNMMTSLLWKIDAIKSFDLRIFFQDYEG